MEMLKMKDIKKYVIKAKCIIKDMIPIIAILAILSISFISGCVTKQENIATTAQATNPTPIATTVKGGNILRLAEMWDIKSIDPAIDGTVFSEKSGIVYQISPQIFR